MSLILKNHTDYDTAFLRDLCKKVLKHEGVASEKYLIEIKTSKTYGTHGKAWMGKVNTTFKRGKNIWARSIEMYLQKPQIGYLDRLLDNNKMIKGKTFYPNIESFVKVLTHEIAHTRGVHHIEMHERAFGDPNYIPRGFIPPKPLEVKPPRDQIKENLLKKRYLKARKYLDQYRSKVKRYAKLSKKYSLKVNYYEKNYTAMCRKVD